jgi:hypothetical protein
MEGMMSDRKNTGAVKPVAKAKPAVKSVAKPVAKPVANTVHSHSDLELSMTALKKQCGDCCKELAELKAELSELKNKLAEVDNPQDSKVDLLLACLKSNGSLQVRKAMRAAGI